MLKNIFVKVMNMMKLLRKEILFEIKLLLNNIV